MANHEKGDETNREYEPELPIIIPGHKDAKDRQEAEDKNRRENNEQLLINLQLRQTSAQEVQARTNKTIAHLTGALIFVSLCGILVGWYQFQAAKDSSNAALAASIAAMQQTRLLQDANKLAVANSAAGNRQFRESLQETETSNGINREALVSVQRAFVVFGKTLNSWPNVGAADGAVLSWISRQ
jgi:hypothetical protein